MICLCIRFSTIILWWLWFQNQWSVFLTLLFLQVLHGLTGWRSRTSARLQAATRAWAAIWTVWAHICGLVIWFRGWHWGWWTSAATQMTLSSSLFQGLPQIASGHNLCCGDHLGIWCPLSLSLARLRFLFFLGSLFIYVALRRLGLDSFYTCFFFLFLGSFLLWTSFLLSSWQSWLITGWCRVFLRHHTWILCRQRCLRLNILHSSHTFFQLFIELEKMSLLLCVKLFCINFKVSPVTWIWTLAFWMRGTFSSWQGT